VEKNAIAGALDQNMESDPFKELAAARGALRLAISVINKLRLGRKVDSLAARKILSRALLDAREMARKQHG
jgi:hypothetical protein